MGTEALRLTLVESRNSPIITCRAPSAGHNRFGFEGGRALKLGATYHLCTAEMADLPMWVKMKLGHWTSAEGITWQRQGTLYESSGEFEGRDPRAALWSPMPIYDETAGRWNFFYVAYHAAPNTETAWRLNEKGRIWRAVSTVPGPEGIGGPYQDVRVVLEPGPHSEPWEGLQGVDSFFPYRVGGAWYAFYGSATSERIPATSWHVGWASAPDLAGPWTRCTSMNPAAFDQRTENPVVTQLADGAYVAVYDTVGKRPDAFGYTYSADGLHWAPGQYVTVPRKGEGGWADHIRTPLGLILEGGDLCRLFYTAIIGNSPKGGHDVGDGRYSSAVGAVTVRLDRTVNAPPHPRHP